MRLGRHLSVPRSLEGALEARSSAVSFVSRDELERPVRHRRILRRIVRLSIEGVLLVLLLSLFIVRFPQVEGRSMEPAIERGNHVLINTLAYEIRLGPLEVRQTAIGRDDIIAFERRQPDEQKLFLKRVIGVAGDVVAINDGVVLVNNVPLNLNHPIIADQSNMPAAIVPAGTVFVIGDNRADSDDSRSFGPVPVASVVGKAMLIIWPLGHVRRVD